MAFNPLDESDPGYQQKVRERAYHLWEADGRPHGSDREYWERARELVSIELAERGGQSDEKNEPKAKKARRKPAKPKSAKT